MSESPATTAGSGVARAIALLNEARGLEPDDPARAAAAIGAVEALLETREPSARERDGVTRCAELDALLETAGVDPERAGVRSLLAEVAERLASALLGHPERRIAVYGSLRPGEQNHRELAHLVGSWSRGELRGVLHGTGGEATRGYPVIELDPAAPAVPVDVFESPALPAHWPRLDAFEGPGYRRVLAVVGGEPGPRVCYVYVASDPPGMPDRN